jgi:hypothetical protein
MVDVFGLWGHSFDESINSHWIKFASITLNEEAMKP